MSWLELYAMIKVIGICLSVFIGIVIFLFFIIVSFK
jgi:hypothetical protein